MPVFNRPELTETSILSFKKNTSLPHTLTVVDNGSDADTKSMLVSLKRAGYIDHLVRLNSNYGVACASNVGWRLISSPCYMKIDNDIEIISDEWLPFAIGTLKKLKFPATLGADFHNQLTTNKHVINKSGMIGESISHVSGGAIIIPKIVSDTLGHWCEDYGLYGCEDGDYGVRMLRTKYKQFYYAHSAFMRHKGKDATLYKNKYNIDKKKLQDKFRNYFKTNNFLITNHHRSPNLPMRFKVSRFDGYNLELIVSKSYKEIWKYFLEFHNFIHGSVFIKSSVYTKLLNKLISVQNKFWESAHREVDLSYDKLRF